MVVRPRASVLRIVSACCAAMALGACVPDTAVHLQLVADPALNSEQQVLEIAEKLTLSLDALGGFSNVGPMGSAAGAWVAENVDSDAEAELVLTRSLDGRSALPRLRLLPGSNIDREFQLNAVGLVGDEIAALGGVSAVRFLSEQAIEVSVPFNLRAAYRPPRVLAIRPRDGQKGLPQALDHVDVEFSATIDPSSATGNPQVIYQGSAGDVPVDGTWSFEAISVRELGLQEKRTMAEFQFRQDCLLNPGTYRVVVRPSITDNSGRSLDQDAASPGDDGYEGRFTVGSDDASPEGSPCAKDAVGCQDPEDCTDHLGTAYDCVIDGGTGIGRCVPAPETCTTLKCEADYVCQPAALKTESARCVLDCRIAGFCSTEVTGSGGKEADGYYCDQGSGLCLPCDDPMGCMVEGCREPEDCIANPGANYDCEIDGNTGIGRCVPLLETCESLQCEGDYVCQPATFYGESDRCVLDCRMFGSCDTADGGWGSEDDTYCDRSTGLCLPCDSSLGCGVVMTPWWYECATGCHSGCNADGAIWESACLTCLQRSNCEACLEDQACVMCLTDGQC